MHNLLRLRLVGKKRRTVTVHNGNRYVLILSVLKLLVELNGVTRMEVLSISKKKGLKQADLKNFCWNIANQYGIDPKTTALFALNLFYAWFSNTEPSSIQKTLRNTAGTYTIGIDANIIDHLPQLEERVLGKNHQ